MAGIFNEVFSIHVQEHANAQTSPMASHVYFVINNQVATPQISFLLLQPSRSPGTVPLGWQCPFSCFPLPAGAGQREGQGAECPPGKERTSQTLCRHLFFRSKPLGRDFLAEQSNSPVLNHRKLGVNQEFPSPATGELQALPGGTWGAWQRSEEELLAGKSQVSVCSWESFCARIHSGCRADPHGVLRGTGAAEQPSHPQNRHCLRRRAKRPTIK